MTVSVLFIPLQRRRGAGDPGAIERPAELALGWFV